MMDYALRLSLIHISSLTAATAEIVKAQMRTADIDWSHIKDLATDTAIITQGKMCIRDRRSAGREHPDHQQRQPAHLQP